MTKPTPLFLSDGRTSIDHALYPKWAAEQSDEVLFFVMRDARQAEVAMPDGPKAWYYADEVNYCANEVARRRGARAALDLGKRAGLLRQSQPTVRPSSLEEVNRSLVGQAQGGMTTSPDRDRNGRQVKEITVKNKFKVGQEVVLVKPDKDDLEAGLGAGVIGKVIKTENDGIPKVNFYVNSGLERFMAEYQLEAFKATKRVVKPADWKYIKGTKSTANYLKATGSNKGIFVKGKDGQDVFLSFGFDGDIHVTIWGGRGKVDFGADDRLTVETRRF